MLEVKADRVRGKPGESSHFQVDLANSGEVIFFCLGVAEIDEGFRHTKFVHVIGRVYRPQN